MICQGRLFIVLILLIFSVPGCAKKKEETSKGWGSFPVQIYSDSSIANSNEAIADLRAAMSFWENKAGKQLFNYQGAWSDNSAPFAGSAGQPSAIFANVIFKQSPWPFGSTIAGQTVVLSQNNRFEGSIILVNPNIPFCSGDCRYSINEVSQMKVFTHELGHFLGLDHSQDWQNIMYPSLEPGGSLDEVSIDQAALMALTG